MDRAAVEAKIGQSPGGEGGGVTDMRRIVGSDTAGVKRSHRTRRGQDQRPRRPPAKVLNGQPGQGPA